MYVVNNNSWILYCKCRHTEAWDVQGLWGSFGLLFWVRHDILPDLQATEICSLEKMVALGLGARLCHTLQRSPCSKDIITPIQFICITLKDLSFIVSPWMMRRGGYKLCTVFSYSHLFKTEILELDAS